MSASVDSSISVRFWWHDGQAGTVAQPTKTSFGTRRLLAGEGNELGTVLAWSLLTVRTTNSGKAFMQIATLEIGFHGSLNDWSPESVLALVTFLVGLLERVKMLVGQTPQFGCTRITWFVQYGQLMVVNYRAYNRCEGGFFFPKPFSNVENLSTTIPPNSTDAPPMMVMKNQNYYQFVLPFLELNAIYAEINPLPDGGAESMAHESTIIEVYLCPSADRPDDDPNTRKDAHYTAVSGANNNSEILDLEDSICGDIDINGLFFPESHTRIGQITDGTSNTLAIGERLYVWRDWLSGSTWKGDPPTRICTGASKNVHYPLNADPTELLVLGSPPLETAPSHVRTGRQHPGTLSKLPRRSSMRATRKEC